MVLLVMAGVQLNLGPLVEQNKTDQMLTLGPYYGKNCLWLPTTCCADKYRQRQLHGTWGSSHNSSQSAAACYNSTATQTVTQLSDYMCCLGPFWGITVCMWLMAWAPHLDLHIGTSEGYKHASLCVPCGDTQVGKCNKTKWQYHKDRKKLQVRQDLNIAKGISN